MTTKIALSRHMLTSVGATTIGHIKNGRTIGHIPDEVMAQPGFYFVVKGEGPRRMVSARFAIGRQKTKQGFRGVLSNIRSDRSQANRTMHYNGVTYEVLYLPVEKMKPLTTGFGKGQLSLMFTKRHEEAFQNLTEMNQMLADTFSFTLQ